MNSNKTLFLRKKIQGENSIEELAQTLATNIPELELVTMPEYSNSLKGIIKNIRYARKHQGQINHIFSSSESYLAIFLKGKNIITRHDVKTGLRSRSRFKRFIRKTFLMIIPAHFADKLTCISQYTANELTALSPGLKRKITIIHNPYNPKLRHTPKTFCTDTPAILHIGTAGRKNLLRVAEALREIPCKLIIVGKLSENQVFALNKNNIHYTHYQDINFNQIIELYQTCDIVSFPSLYEGFGMPVIEANATGRVVLASREASIPEIAGNSVHYVDAYSTEDIRNGFKKIINEREYRDTLIAKGLENAERFHPRQIIGKYSELYENLIHNTKNKTHH